MFGFYIGKPILEIDDEEVYIDIDGFGECLSGTTRDIFINAGINKILIENGKQTIGNGSSVFIRYLTIKDNLEKIRYENKIYGTDDLYVDRCIKKAIKKHGEQDLFCMFN